MRHECEKKKRERLTQRNRDASSLSAMMKKLRQLRMNTRMRERGGASMLPDKIERKREIN